jgi:hypothetical protein
VSEHREQGGERLPEVRADWRGFWLLPVVALLLGLLLWHDQQQVAAARAEAARVAAEAEQKHRTIGAPTVRKGKPVKVKGKVMATWIVSGAGVSAYDGTYTEDGTYDSAPAYTNGSKWMYKTSEGGGGVLLYSFGPTKGDVNTVYVTTSALPGNPWSPAIEGVGEPAPTVAASVGTPPWTGPYPPVPWDAPWIPGPTPCKPARATIGGAEYVCWMMDDIGVRDGIITYCPATAVWGWAPAVAAVQATWDDYFTAGAFDAGDGASLYVFSGAYLDTGVWYLKVATHTLVPGTSTTQAALDTLTLASGDISNFVQVGDADFLCMMVDGGAYKLCSYGVGDGSLKVERNWSSIAPLPSGYSAVQLGALARYDHYLYREPNTGALYWLRHCKNAVSQHRIVAYQIAGGSTSSPPPLYGNSEWALVGDQLIGQTITQLPDVILAGTRDTTCQTWGAYSYPAGNLVGDLTETYANDDVYRDVTSLRWQPGGNGRIAQPFVGNPAGRRWYLDGSPLYLAGWCVVSYKNVPFLVLATPGSMAVESATLALTAADVSIAHRVGMESATLALTAADVSIRDVHVLGLEPAQIALSAADVTIIGQTNRTPGVSTAQWYEVRARALV